MTPARRVPATVLVVVVALLALTGCVQVPTAGPVEKVPGQAEVCQNCISVEVAPPAPGATPRDVVDGYLRAMYTYQPKYATARQFLTTAAADTWRPEDGVLIYRGAPEVVGNRVRLTGDLVGRVSADRTYSARDENLDLDLGLRQEKGEWRISAPPAGLLVSAANFSKFWSGYSNYFVGNRSSLVPERIYLPTLRNPANIASALMKALLDGPSDWARPAVDSSIPMGTSLSVDSVPIANGIAEVPLNNRILTLPDSERTLMAAQIVYTLRQVPGVKGVLITVDQQRFRVPEADQTSLVIPVDAFSRDIDPVQSVSEQLYAVRNGKVSLVTTPNERPGLQPVIGPLGEGGGTKVDSLAVSVNGTDLAAVTDGRTALRRADTATGGLVPLRENMTQLLRPQFTRYGEVWAVGDHKGKQRLVMSAPGDRQATLLKSPAPGGRITAFRISPDGARMALVLRTPGGFALGLARIVRNGKVAVDGWRPIDVTQDGFPEVTRIVDVAWVDANDLLVLGAPSAQEPPAVLRVAADASQIATEGGDPSGLTARELTVLSRPQTFILVGSSAQPDEAWRRSGDQWQLFLLGVSTLAFAG
jgi:lipoprotein LpqB-like beta-propeller protein/sporulation and spore germination protein